jgi:glucose-6-phosphate 1-dehydrogenase
MAGDPTLFMRRDAVEAAWRWVAPILDQWALDTETPLATHPAGDWGPPEADRLIESTGRRWRPLQIASGGRRLSNGSKPI